jgi:hypothetical protein
MFASRVLPPIRTPSSPPPVATFYNVPRRYVKSNMQVGGDTMAATIEDGKAMRSTRKNSKIQIPRSVAAPSPDGHAKEGDSPSPVASPRAIKKRNASLGYEINGDELVDSGSPTEIGTPVSVSSTGAGDFPASVCLCQPEPKIPRPRNGKSSYSLSSEWTRGWVETGGPCCPFRSVVGRQRNMFFVVDRLRQPL